jgi:hypothetical protein
LATVVFYDLSGNELVVDLPDRHGAVFGQYLNRGFHQFEGFGVAAHGTGLSVPGLSAGGGFTPWTGLAEHARQATQRKPYPRKAALSRRRNRTTGGAVQFPAAGVTRISNRGASGFMAEVAEFAEFQTVFS